MRASFSRPLVRELARTLDGPLSVAVGGATGVSEAEGINPFNALNLTLVGTTYTDSIGYQDDPAPGGLRSFQFGDGQTANGPPWLSGGGTTNDYTFASSGYSMVIGAATTPALVEDLLIDPTGLQTTGPLCDPRGFPNLEYFSHYGKLTGTFPTSWDGWAATLELIVISDSGAAGATISGTIPSFATAPFAGTLMTLNLGILPQITGALPTMTPLVAATSIELNNLGVTGNIPRPPVIATLYHVSSCAGITGYAGGTFPVTLLDATFSANALTQAAVDALLAAAVAGGASGGSLEIDGGTNAAPSAAGLASIVTLTGRGWTVTNN